MIYFNCPNCKQETLEYNGSEHKENCDKCGYRKVILGEEKTCFRCAKSYIEYTWFDPSGCDCCGASFVD